MKTTVIHVRDFDPSRPDVHRRPPCAAPGLSSLRVHARGAAGKAIRGDRVAESVVPANGRSDHEGILMHATKKLPPEGFRQALSKALAEQKDRRPRADKLTLKLPWPPSTNNLYRSYVTPTGQVRRAKSKRAREYAKLVKQRVQDWAVESSSLPPVRPFQWTLLGWPPDDGQKHDLTNTFKLVEDALFAAIYSVADRADDNEVRRVVAEKMEPSGRGRIEITLETFHPTQRGI